MESLASQWWLTDAAEDSSIGRKDLTVRHEEESMWPPILPLSGVTVAEASNGKRILYEYDAAGCLARVQRADSQVALHEYNAGYRMTSFSVAFQPGARPENVLTNQYDDRGRLTCPVIAGVGVFKVDYLVTGDNKYARELRVTDPAGRVLKTSIGHEYVVHADKVRFPRAYR